MTRRADDKRAPLYPAFENSWKRGGLSPAMRSIVNSVRLVHHGPKALGEDE